MIKPKIKGWEEVTIAQYYKLREIAEDEELDNISKEVKYISEIYGISENDVWGMELSNIGELRKNIGWLNSAEFPHKQIYGTIAINGTEYVIPKNLNAMTYAQYVDFQSYYLKKDMEAELLSVFIVPKGKRYNTDYDLDQTISDIREYVSIATYKNIIYNFFRLSLHLTDNTVAFLKAQKKVRKMIAMTQQTMRKLTNKTKHICGFH